MHTCAYFLKTLIASSCVSNCTSGTKRAIDKANQYDESLDRFTKGQAEVKKKFQDLHKVSCADGESAAQLAFRLAKEMGVLPNQRAVLRCEGHFGQKALEHALPLHLVQ